MYSILKFIPKNHLSFLIGCLVRIRLPGVLGRLSVRLFVYFLKIDPITASKELHEYPCISDFFVRDLKPGLRPVAKGLVSPIDGTLRSYGIIEEGLITQVKGKDYSVEDLLCEPEIAKSFYGGKYYNMYLSPQDYHHVHAPIAGDLLAYTHIPGKLWPVNDWSLYAIDGLFVVNERVVLYLESEFGRVAVVMVGATNVGRISLEHCELLTNTIDKLFLNSKLPRRVELETVQKITAGERLGTFYMGSSVVLLLPPGANTSLESVAPRSLKYGEEL